MISWLLEIDHFAQIKKQTKKSIIGSSCGNKQIKLWKLIGIDDVFLVFIKIKGGWLSWWWMEMIVSILNEKNIKLSI